MLLLRNMNRWTVAKKFRYCAILSSKNFFRDYGYWYMAMASMYTVFAVP